MKKIILFLLGVGTIAGCVAIGYFVQGSSLFTTETNAEKTEESPQIEKPKEEAKDTNTKSEKKKVEEVAPTKKVWQLKESYDWDLRKKYSWQNSLLSEAELTPKIKKVMRDFTAVCRVTDAKPKNLEGAGVPDKQFKSLVAEFHKIFPTAPGEEGPRARATIGDTKKQGEEKLARLHVKKTLWPLQKRLLAAYISANKEQAGVLEDCYRRLAQCFIVSEYYPGDKMEGWLDNGYKWRGYASNFIQMAHTLPKREKNLMLEALTYIGEGKALMVEKPSTNTDQHLNKFPHVFNYVAKMDDSPAKWQRILGLRRGMDLSVVDGNSITPDGGIIHHDGHHNDYAGYSFKTLIDNQMKFARAGVIGKYTKEAVERYRIAVRSWAFNSMRGEVPTVMQLRPSPIAEASRAGNQGLGRILEFAIATAKLSALVNETDWGDDRGMARLAASKTGGDPKQLKLLPKEWKHFLKDEKFVRPLAGHNPFPVMGLSTHRRKNWVAMIRGANKYYRGGEVYSHAYHPGAYCDRILNGALFIFSKGKEGRFPNSVDSGFRQEGYDPNMFPNVTAPMISNPALAGRGIPDYFHPASKQGGGTDLDGNGTWSYLTGNERKSAFFFGNKITLMATNINVGGNVRTCLFQQVHDDLRNEPIQVGLRTLTEPLAMKIKADKASLLLDANHTGYYIPSGNPEIKIKRGDQGYTYASNKTLKKGEDPKTMNLIKRRPGLEKYIDKFNPTVRPVSLAYFDHGANPKNQSYQYTVLVHTTMNKLKAFRAAMKKRKKPFTSIRESNYHLVADRRSRTWGIATFVADCSIDSPIVKKVSRASTVMCKLAKQKIKISAAATDRGNKSAIELTLAGQWKLAPDQNFKGSVDLGEGITTLSITYLGQAPVKVNLEKIE